MEFFRVEVDKGINWGICKHFVPEFDFHDCATELELPLNLECLPYSVFPLLPTF